MKVLGAEHPHTLTSMDNLARTWRGTGKKTAAVQMMSDCVQRRRRVLGASHPYYLGSHATLVEWQTEQADTSGSS